MRISVWLTMFLVYLYVRHNVPLDEGVREFISTAAMVSILICVGLDIKEVFRSLE